jgi:hypothetical protein
MSLLADIDTDVVVITGIVMTALVTTDTTGVLGAACADNDSRCVSVGESARSSVYTAAAKRDDVADERSDVSYASALVLLGAS